MRSSINFNYIPTQTFVPFHLDTRIAICTAIQMQSFYQYQIKKKQKVEKHIPIIDFHFTSCSGGTFT